MGDRPVVIVTGASRGMGASVARWLATKGAAVAVIARNREALSRISGDMRRLGGDPLAITADVSDREACNRIVLETLNRFGRLDALVNNAGVLSPIAPIAEADHKSWLYNVQVNLIGPFYLTQAAIPPLRSAMGRVVNVSSGAAVRPMESWSAYCTAKAALTHFTRVLASEETAITAVALRPGVVDTEMQALIRREGPKKMTRAQNDYFQRLKLEGRLEPPFVPARAIAWLALQAPREWTGEFLEYDDPRIAQAALALFGEPSESVEEKVEDPTLAPDDGV